MSQVSLQASINGNKVDVGYASRIQSDRVQNPQQMTCPLWTGLDLAGRPVCSSSFRTKMEGCNSAEDRLFVENSLRPRYTNYVTLSAAGVMGDGMYDSKNNIIAAGALANANARAAALAGGPHFGTATDRVRGVSSGKLDVEAANAFGQSTQDGDAAYSLKSRQAQKVVIGSQTANKMDRSNTKIASANGDYMGRAGNSQGYMRVASYP